MTLEALAYLGAVDPATISRMERGIGEPERETVVRVAKALGISVSRFRALLAEGATGE